MKTTKIYVLKENESKKVEIKSLTSAFILDYSKTSYWFGHSVMEGEKLVNEMLFHMNKGDRILALDENEIYILDHDVKPTDKVSRYFNFLARKETSGVIRGFSFDELNVTYTKVY